MPMRSEEEIKKVRNILMNELLERVTRGNSPPKKTHATERLERLRTLQWVLGEFDISPAQDEIKKRDAL